MAHCVGAKVALDVMLRVCVVAIVGVPVVGAASHIRSCVLGVWYFCKYKRSAERLVDAARAQRVAGCLVLPEPTGPRYLILYQPS